MFYEQYGIIPVAVIGLAAFALMLKWRRPTNILQLLQDPNVQGRLNKIPGTTNWFLPETSQIIEGNVEGLDLYNRGWKEDYNRMRWIQNIEQIQDDMLDPRSDANCMDIPRSTHMSFNHSAGLQTQGRITDTGMSMHMNAVYTDPISHNTPTGNVGNLPYQSD